MDRRLLLMNRLSENGYESDIMFATRPVICLRACRHNKFNVPDLIEVCIYRLGNLIFLKVVIKSLTDLGVLDLRIGYRWGHQMKRCHERSRVVLHLSWQFNFTGGHCVSWRCRLGFFPADLRLLLWNPSCVYNQVSALVHFYWAEKRAVLLI